jgi:hypothetical protein
MTYYPSFPIHLMTNETFGNHKKSLRLKFINMKTLILLFLKIKTKLISVMLEPMLCLLLNLSNQPCEIFKLYYFSTLLGSFTSYIKSDSWKIMAFLINRSHNAKMQLGKKLNCDKICQASLG